MTTYGPYTAFDVEFDTGGHLVDPSSQQDLISWLSSPPGAPITDLVVISHGWNNDITEARALYSAFFQSMGITQGASGAAGRKFAVAAIFWPSKRFADSDLIPGGAAAIAPALSAQLNAQLDQVKAMLASDPTASDRVEHAREQIAKLEVSQSAQDDFVFALAGLLPRPRGSADEGLDDSITALQTGQVQGHAVLARLSAPIFPIFPSPNGSTGHALGLGGIVSGVTGAASRLLNLFTYYAMKDRAGIVGVTGASQMIQAIQSARPALRIHLIGHSFGGRLVTAAANTISRPRTIASMLLLEAAYSHNGLAQNWDGQGHDGAFRNVMSLPEIGGSILITHSVHDTAVGLAYPLASRVIDQVAAAFGDKNDRFGGMGRNGAQHTPEAFDDFLLPVGAIYSPLPGGKTIRNLNGDGPAPKPVIMSHGDVAKPEITWAWLSSL